MGQILKGSTSSPRNPELKCTFEENHLLKKLRNPLDFFLSCPIDGVIGTSLFTKAFSDVVPWFVEDSKGAVQRKGLYHVRFPTGLVPVRSTDTYSSETVKQ